MLETAKPGDEIQLDAFLARFPETSMFLRGNLADHGIGSDDPHGTTFYVWQDRSGIRAVFGRTNSGFLLTQNPENNAEIAAEFAAKVASKPFVGMTGNADQVPLVIDALGYPQDAYKLAVDQPLYSLNLAYLPPRLHVDNLRAPTSADESRLTEWFAQYEIDTGLSTPGPAVDNRAIKMAKRAIHRTTMRIYEEKGSPAAMTAFNAVLPDIVQVGGVFVRRDLRCKQIGRRVVASHLIEARDRGVKQAILFAAAERAARCYEGIGFQKIGAYRLCLMADSEAEA